MVSGRPHWVGEEELLDAVTTSAAADALTAALRLDDLPKAPQRTVIDAGSGQFLSMAAGGPQGAGAKLVTVQPSNPGRGLPLIQGVFALFSADRQELVALFDGAALTCLRCPAVSVVATRALARDDARHLVVFGAGVQARAHAHAMLAERGLERITVVSRGHGAEALVRELRLVGIEAARGTTDAVAEADIVCTCTTAGEPLFSGDELALGAHVNAIGSFRPGTREIDGRLLERSTVAVDDRGSAINEAGDLRMPLQDGVIGAESIAGDLRALARGVLRRNSKDEITTFKSVGSAWQDLVVAQAAWDRIDGASGSVAK